MKFETCVNCGRTIGNLETPYVVKDNIVCNQCYKILTGHPIKLSSAKEPGRVIVQSGQVTTEKTAKRWKGRQVFGIILLVAGLGWSKYALLLESEKGMMTGVIIGVVMFSIGLSVYVHARLSSWWHHG